MNLVYLSECFGQNYIIGFHLHETTGLQDVMEVYLVDPGATRW